MSVRISNTQIKFKDENGTYQDVNAISPEAPVQDVQINDTSIVQNGVASIPRALPYGGYGVVRVENTQYTGISTNKGLLHIVSSNQEEIKAGANDNRPTTPSRQHMAVFYGLAKAAGVDMASSSNAVGEYTDEAKIAIQKMLGIYEAPWELIREDTGTNTTSADIEIDVDGNGQAFELTDIRILFATPTQETDAIVGNYGRIRCLRSGTNLSDTLYMGPYSQTAQTTGRFSAVQLIQRNGMIERTNWKNVTNNTDKSPISILTTPGGTSIWELASKSYNKIEIQAITGTWKYWLYGKRKWQ